MKISVFGNKDYEPDSLPLKMMPKLAEKFPEFIFVAEDPNELNIPEGADWWIIDTVRGLKKVQVLELESLKKSKTGQVSMHGFDLGTHLFWINKLRKNLKIHIIGIPPQLSLEEAYSGARAILANLQLKSEKRS